MPKKAPVRTETENQLAEHLRLAEDHLVKAVELFLGDSKLSRRVGYLTRLVGAQEAITALYREELLLIRGPIKIAVKRKRK